MSGNASALRIQSPAPLFQARALFQGAVNLKPVLQQVATLQLTRATTFAIYAPNDGLLLLVAGFFPLGDHVEEVFFAFAAPDLVRPHIVAVARAAHLTLAARRHCGVVAFIALVAVGHEPGARMAAMAGFSRIGLGPHGFDVWEARA